MATLKELYQHKKFAEQQGYEISDKLLQDIEQKELECLNKIPDWAVNSLPVRTDVDEYSGPFTVLIEYDNNEMVGAGVSKNFPAYDNSDYYIDARKEYPELFESSQPIKEEEPSTHAFSSRSKSIGFSVHFADGKIIDGTTACQVMIDTLRYMGLENASHWQDVKFKGFPLVGKEKRSVPDGSGIRQKWIDGWYIYVNLPNYRKIACLKGVANMLGISIEIKSKTEQSLFEDYDESKDTVVETERKSRQTYNFNGMSSLTKGRAVFEAIKQLLVDIPNTTYKELDDLFPHSLQGSYGVIETLSQIENRREKGQEVQKRYFLSSSDILTSADGIKFAVSTQWDYKNFPAIQNVINNFLGYQLEES